MPARNVPKVDVPLMDKWVHFTFFGGFTFFWLCSKPNIKTGWLLSILAIAVSFGCTIEVVQGLLPALGRASEVMDAAADSIGALLGIGLFYVLARMANKAAC